MAEQTKIDNHAFNPLHMVLAALLFQKKKGIRSLFFMLAKAKE